MPYVSIQVSSDGLTSAKKSALIRGTTELLVEVLQKRPESVYVVIDEVAPENWGIGHKSVKEIRAEKQGGPQPQ